MSAVTTLASIASNKIFIVKLRDKMEQEKKRKRKCEKLRMHQNINMQS